MDISYTNTQFFDPLQYRYPERRSLCRNISFGLYSTFSKLTGRVTGRGRHCDFSKDNQSLSLDWSILQTFGLDTKKDDKLLTVTVSCFVKPKSFQCSRRLSSRSIKGAVERRQASTSESTLIAMSRLHRHETNVIPLRLRRDRKLKKNATQE